MSVKTRIQQWLKSALSDSARGHMRDRRHRGYRASVESLESRVLLTAYSITNLNDAGAGSLRDAISQANANSGADEIAFSVPGTITLTTGEIVITDSLTVHGSSTTISGNNASRIFLVGGLGSKTVSLSSLTLRDGNGAGAVTSGVGGAIFLTDSFEGNDVLNLQDCTLTANSATLGGAIHAVDSTLNIVNCLLTNNSATGSDSSNSTQGGGAIAVNSAVTLIQNSTISDNTATSTGGGGIYNVTSVGAVGQRNSTLTVINSIIRKNMAYIGGGIYNLNQNAGEAAILRVIGSTFDGNFATDSGGGLLTNSVASFTGTTFTDNYGLSGGAIYNYSGVVTLTNSTLSGNRAGVFGGGIWNLLSGSMLINGCSLIGNRADSDGNTYGVGGAVSEFLAPVVSRNSIYAGNVRGAAGNDVPDDVTKDPATLTPAFIPAASFNNLIGDPGSAGGLIHGQNGNVLGNGFGVLRPLAQILNPMLANNGGPTQTHSLAVGSPAIDAGALIPDVLVTPVSATSGTSGTDLLPAADLVHGVGLTLQNYSTTDDGASRWATNAPNGAGSDYFTNGSPSPALTFSLDNIYLLTDIAVWGSSDAAANDDAKTLQVEFSLDGGTTFPTSVAVTKPRYSAQSFVHTLPFGGALAANAVRVTVVDNYFGEAGSSGGNRVSLDEIRFLQRGLATAFDQRGSGFSRVLEGDHTGGPVIDVGAFEASGIRLTSPNPNAFSLRPTFTWTPIAGATSYAIQINNESTNVAHFHDATSSVSLYTPTVDLAIGKFKMWVRPVFATGPGNWSAPQLFNNLAKPTWQTMPRTQLTSRPTLNWNTLPGAAKYDLWIDNYSTGQKQLIRQEVTGTSFTPSADLPMGIYRCWIRGIDAKGNFAGWSVLQELLVVPGPMPIGPLSATFDRTPTFSWNPVTGADSYELSVKNQTTGAMVINGQSVTATNFTPVSSLTDGPYRWWTLAVSPASIGPIRSGGSNPTDIYVGGRPTIIAPVAGSSTSDRTPTFTWRVVDGAASYQLTVNRINIAQAGIIARTGLTTTSFTPATALPAGTYRAWVRAVSTTGELSPWSIEVNFTVTATVPAIDSPETGPKLTGLLASALTQPDDSDPESSKVPLIEHPQAEATTHNPELEVAIRMRPSDLFMSPDACVRKQYELQVDRLMAEFTLHEFTTIWIPPLQDRL